MADDSLANIPDYTIHLTAEEHKKFQRLLFTGSVLAQLLQETYFDQRDKAKFLQYSEALKEVAHFLTQGQRYSNLWSELAQELFPLFEN